MERIAAEHPDALLLSGDVPYDGSVVNHYETGAWREAKLRVYPAIGNHELHGDEVREPKNWWHAFPELMGEHDKEKQRADEHERRAEQEAKRGDELRVEMLRLQLELERYKKWYYGPRADRLQSSADLAQLLLNFAAEMDRKPVNPDDLPSHSESTEELRRMKRRKGRRNLANFENLPVTTQVHELNSAERACPCCGIERKEIGTDESWQVEYLPGHFERIHHLRKKYACQGCESNGNNPQMETAAKPEMAIDKGMAGPGLLAYIATSKFSDYLPLYRLEDIFKRQRFEISRATQSVWCGDMADLAEPLWELIAERVRASHVVATDDTIMPMLSKGKTANARMWVYVGDDDYPYNVFDFTLKSHLPGQTLSRPQLLQGRSGLRRSTPVPS